MLYPGQALPCGCAVARALLGDDDPRHVRHTLQQRAEQRLRRLGVASALHEESEDVVVWIDRAPPVMAFAMDRQPYLIQVPLVAWLRAPVPSLIRVILATFATPLTHGLRGHHDPTGHQHRFHIAVTQAETGREPDAMADHCAGKAMVLGACGLGRRDHGWLPLLRCLWSVRKSCGGEYGMNGNKGQHVDNACT